VNPRVVIARPALRSLLGHAAGVAKASRSEALGWLLGFFTEDAVYVADAAPCTRYRSQSRYGAEAEPAEEVALAARHPRAIGLVGLYHSHPFGSETEHARFHSHTDDATLRSRASRAEDYLSVVTDTKEATFFVLRRGRPLAVKPEVVDDVRCEDLLKRYTAEVSVRVSVEGEATTLPPLVAALAKDLRGRIDEGAAAGEVRGGRVRLPGLEGEATGSALRVKRHAGGVRAELELRLTPTVYLRRDGEEVLRAVREELHDDAAYLLHRAADGGELGDASYFEVPLGRLSVRMQSRLPVKAYRAPKRASVRRR